MAALFASGGVPYDRGQKTAINKMSAPMEARAQRMPLAMIIRLPMKSTFLIHRTNIHNYPMHQNAPLYADDQPFCASFVNSAPLKILERLMSFDDR